MAADSLFGKTWNMQPQASVFSAGFAPANETRLYEQQENGYKLTVSGTHNSRPYQWSYQAYYDRNPHPVVGRTDVDAITIVKLSDSETGASFR
jgi:hypothetical protein